MLCAQSVLLLVSVAGGDVTRSEFFAQFWQQIGLLKVKIEKKGEVPLFQENKGSLVPVRYAVLERKLRVSTDELDRIFAAKIAPYYRAIGRIIIQCIAATDDQQGYGIKIAGHAMPFILRNKIFRGVDPMDECYPIEDLIKHSFLLLGMEDMSRDKAFEYFGIDIRDFDDVDEAVRQIRVEIYEMWIKERLLAIKALEEGLTLNGLADITFVTSMVPLEAINEILFSK
jgi:hypothetical protein